MTLCLQDLIIFIQLHLVVLNRFSQRIWIGDLISIFDVVQLLQAIDGNGEYLPRGLKHRSMLLPKPSQVKRQLLLSGTQGSYTGATEALSELRLLILIVFILHEE